MTKRMQHCFNCGKEIGIYNKPFGDLDTCGEAECNRAERDAYGERESYVREQAEQDNYNRYK